MKPIIKVTINTPELNKYVKYNDWNGTVRYLQDFVYDIALSIKVAQEDGVILDDILNYDDKKRL